MKEEEILLRELLIIYEYENVEYELLNHYRASFIFAKFNLDYRMNKLKSKILSVSYGVCAGGIVTQLTSK